MDARGTNTPTLSTGSSVRLRVISLGAGVQSTTMALMAAHGEIGPMPDCAIFADTGWEPRKVYEHLDWLEKQLPFPVHRVGSGSLRDDIAAVRAGRLYHVMPIPAHVMRGGKYGGPINRSCTRDYKITPIRRKLRELLGIVGARSPNTPIAEQWIGISTDEASRVKPAGEHWFLNRWPLIDARMSRWDCLQWIRRKGYPQPPKSSCVGCPFHGDDEWRGLTAEEFADAVEVDRRLREPNSKKPPGQDLYLHRSCVPLDEADLSTAEDRGQGNLFNNECEGMCGV